MAFASLGQLIQATQKSATTSWSPSPNVATTIGTLAIIALAKDNTSTANGDNGEVTAVTDSVGNTWTKVIEFSNAEGAAGTGATASIWQTIAGSALSTAGTITFTFLSTNTAKAVTGWRFSMTTTATSLVASTTLADTAADAGPMNLTGLASSEHLFFRGGAIEDSTTTYTVSANYTVTSTGFAQSTTSGGAAATNMGARGEFRIVTQTSDTTDPTTSVADQASVYFAINQSSGLPASVSWARGHRMLALGVGA